MGFEDILSKEDVTIRDLQEFQKAYDERFVDQKFSGSDEKIRHTALHLAKLLGRLADYSEQREHGDEVSLKDIREKVVPDLMVYCLWLAREAGVEPDKAYFKRMVGNMERLYADKISEEELTKLRGLVEGH